MCERGRESFGIKLVSDRKGSCSYVRKEECIEGKGCKNEGLDPIVKCDAKGPGVCDKELVAGMNNK